MQCCCSAWIFLSNLLRIWIALTAFVVQMEKNTTPSRQKHITIISKPPTPSPFATIKPTPVAQNKKRKIPKMQQPSKNFNLPTVKACRRRSDLLRFSLLPDNSSFGSGFGVSLGGDGIFCLATMNGSLVSGIVFIFRLRGTTAALGRHVDAFLIPEAPRIRSGFFRLGNSTAFSILALFVPVAHRMGMGCFRTCSFIYGCSTVWAEIRIRIQFQTTTLTKHMLSSRYILYDAAKGRSDIILAAFFQGAFYQCFHASISAAVLH